MTPDVGEGTDRNYPSIEQIFSDVEAPGLIEQPSYLHTTFFADVDYRDQRGRPRSGGFYHVAMGFWNDRTLDRYDFKRFDANVSQFVPLDAAQAARPARARRPQLRQQRDGQPGAVLLPAVCRRRRHDPRLPRVPVPGRERVVDDG